ncbi:MAG: Gfo/Idh/MocA family oxidoreductase [Victivallales bacterium]|jgi:predicted dehydrogenase|nr:Gfo/Idh/MocA family oxidoreductase [Victivallales bacterium]MBT7300258.1 Gfo/Idh/MocA family oxidoreductase [Victivallales bacterium]
MALRIGFVGVGGIAQRHLGNAALRDDVEIVGHADIVPERAQAAADKFGGLPYDDCVALYEAQKPDAVIICTSPDAHGRIEEEAAARGIPFFVEKPVAVDVARAARVKKAVDAAGITTQVGYMYRFSEAVRHAKKLLADRPIAMVQQHFYMPGLPAREWWPDVTRSGGQLVEQSTHMLDLGRYLVGDVVSVRARTARVRDWTPNPDTPPGDNLLWAAEGFTIPDTCALIMEYACGALGTLSCSMVPGTAWDCGFRIVAEGLIVTIDGGDVRWAGEESGEMKAGDNWVSYVLYDFLDAVRDGRPSLVPYDEGVRSLAISVAGYEAEAKGAAVCPQDLIAPLFAG